MKIVFELVTVVDVPHSGEAAVEVVCAYALTVKFGFVNCYK